MPAKKTLKKSPRAGQTIDSYLAAISGDRRAALDRLRQLLRSVLPRAEECISYGLPAFRVDGRVVAGFAARCSSHQRNRCPSRSCASSSKRAWPKRTKAQWNVSDSRSANGAISAKNASPPSVTIS